MPKHRVSYDNAQRGLLSEPLRRRRPQRLARCRNQRARLGLAFALFIFGDTVGNDARSCLDVHDALFEHRCP